MNSIAHGTINFLPLDNNRAIDELITLVVTNTATDADISTSALTSALRSYRLFLRIADTG